MFEFLSTLICRRSMFKMLLTSHNAVRWNAFWKSHLIRHFWPSKSRFEPNIQAVGFNVMSTVNSFLAKGMRVPQHIEVQAYPKKMTPKNRCYFLHLWEKRDYPMTFFFRFSLRLFEFVEVKWQSMLSLDLALSSVNCNQENWMLVISHHFRKYIFNRSCQKISMRKNYT